MDDATKKEYLRRHWLVWNWLAEHPRNTKHDAFEALFPEAFDEEGWCEVENGCYLCEIYLRLDDNSREGCKACPLCMAWGQCCTDGPNIYDDWDRATESHKVVSLATLIRDVVPRPEGL